MNPLLLKIVGGLLLIAIIVGMWFYIQDLKKDLKIAEQNAKGLADSLRISETQLGEVGQRYALQHDLSDSLKGRLEFANQRLISQTSVIARLTAQLHSAKPETIRTTDSSFVHTFSDTLSDSGMTVQTTDSVAFNKASEKVWTGQHWLSINTWLKLVQRITRDKQGFLSGSVETKSSRVHIADLQTIVDDEYAMIEPPFWTNFRLEATVGHPVVSDGSLRVSPTLWYGSWGGGVDYQKGEVPYYKLGYSLGK